MEKLILDPDVYPINRKEAKALISFIYAQGYVSEEFHPEITPLLKRLEQFDGGRRGQVREIDSPSE